MRTRMKTNPTALLFGAYRRQVLGLLLGRPEGAFHVREIARQSGVPVGSLHRELRALADAGILERTPVDRQVRYQANRRSPLFGPLSAIFGGGASAFAIAEPAAAYASKAPVAEPAAAARRKRALDRLNVSQRVLSSLARRHHLKKMALFGSVTRNDFRTDSDVDVLVEFSPEHARAAFARVHLAEELSVMFGGRKVDVVTKDVFRNPLRRESIEQDLLAIHGSRQTAYRTNTATSTTKRST